MENKISALLVVHNEEKVIERCLKSIKDVVDEIIVIHDGPCGDQTINIAKKYTNIIFETEVRKGIGESWYIKGFKKSKFNWILRIDADEYLSSDLQKKIRSLLNTKEFDAYSFLWPMWNGKYYINTDYLRKNFLFRKSSIGFIDRFHFPIRVNGIVCESNYIVHHKPTYDNWSQKTFNNKQKHWAVLQARDFLEPIESKEIYNIDIDIIRKEEMLKKKLYKYPLFVLIMTYLIHMKTIFRMPHLIFERGFWIFGLTTARYSYEVAKEVGRITK